nr:MAG TPA: hypothetical protein [Caudoviricetes sp.]
MQPVCWPTTYVAVVLYICIIKQKAEEFNTIFREPGRLPFVMPERQEGETI